MIFFGYPRVKVVREIKHVLREPVLKRHSLFTGHLSIHLRLALLKDESKASTSLPKLYPIRVFRCLNFQPLYSRIRQTPLPSLLPPRLSLPISNLIDRGGRVIW